MLDKNQLGFNAKNVLEFYCRNWPEFDAKNQLKLMLKIDENSIPKID